MKLILSLWVIFPLSLAVDLYADYEGSCIKPPTVEIDPEILSDSDAKWYVNLASNYMHIRFLMTILEKPADKISDKDLENSCIFANFGPDMKNMKMTANGKSQKWEIMRAYNGIYEGKFGEENPVYETTYSIMTDNESYMVLITYWDNINVGWAVSSKRENLDENLINKITKYIESFGFDMKKTYKLNPKTCN